MTAVSGDDVICIGAGPAGLTAAYLLSKQGKSVTVLEADPTLVGGISRTVDYKGFKFDIGGHRFFSKADEVEALWNELLPHDMLTRPRQSRIYYRGQFFSYPLKAWDALTKLGLIESCLCVMSYLKVRLLPAPTPRNFQEWITSRFGARLFNIFFKTYTEKVWGMPCKEISADWAAQRIKGFSLGEAIKSALIPQRQKSRKEQTTTLIDSFRYPKFGPGMMWEEAAKRIRNLGNQVLMGSRVSALEWDVSHESWTVSYQDLSGELQKRQAKHVISSAPMRDLIKALPPGLACEQAANALRYRDFLTVALVLKDREVFTDNWIYIHDPGVRVGRIQNFKSWSEFLIPNPRQNCLGLEYFCFEGDGLWTSSESELIELATSELVTLGLASRSDVLDGHVVRQPKAYPVYDEHYESHVSTVRKELEGRYPTLHLVGRNGMHRYNNQDHSMMTAMLTVKNILNGKRLYDPWAVNEEAIYHEEKSAPVTPSDHRLPSQSTSGLRQVPTRVTPPAPPQPLLSHLSRNSKMRFLDQHLPRGSRILEVGAGDGWFAAELRRRGHVVTTIDLETGSEIVGDIRNWRKLGLKENGYDAVIALEVIEHVDCVEDINSLCRPGGYLFLSSPFPRYDWVMKILETIGLTQKRTSPHDHLVDFRTLPLIPVELRRPAGIHQVGLFTKRPKTSALRFDHDKGKSAS